MFYSRPTLSGIRYAKATVDGVNGVILLPNDWDASVYDLNNTNSSGANFTSNTVTVADWTNTLEANGSVFLPAAGYRYGTSVYNVGSYGYYWSSSYYNSSDAYYVYFYSGDLDPQRSSYRYYGRSVHLVRLAE